MIRKEITVGLKEGLGARPVAHFVQAASEYQSRITIECGEKQVNAKSIMGMMSLGLACGETIMVSASGGDESAAVEGIVKFLTAEE